MARKILLADDSVTAQNMGRKILVDAGYEVIAVNNGSAALKKIAEFKPDLAILDVYMPGYSGLEVCQRLKESQETARIPVLLSVGKLEPFKPEEAQRVRAEAYIVKPFEASELLSALAKLEDKIVPRAEPSKPGRFARAIAAAEETNRGRTEAPVEATGWKNRIGFPQQRTEPEEKVADESSIYNPMNRDLRTVVETPAEKLAVKASEYEKETEPPAATAAEGSIDLAALIPAGLPKDVTPEEIAAIASAAAQIQRAASVEHESRDFEIVSAETGVSETQISAPVSPATAHPAWDEDKRGEPVTMAAAAESREAANEGPSRWTAVSVALESDEELLSLEHEMQKAYAASSTAGADFVSAGSVSESQPAPDENGALITEPAEAPVVAISTSEPAPVPEPAPTISPDAPPAWPDSAAAASVALSEAATPHSSFLPDEFLPADLGSAEPVNVPEHVIASGTPTDVAAPQPITLEAPVEAHADVSPSISECGQEPVAEFVSPALEAEIAAVALPAAEQEQSAPNDEPAIAAAAAASNAFAPIVRDTEPAESTLDPETVKSTAAAWASWRQIREASQSEIPPIQSGQEQAGPKPERENGTFEPQDTSAMAVAAGAETISQETSAAPTSSHTADVASIVESVLAGLRPKLMEEISRKMAEKK